MPGFIDNITVEDSDLAGIKPDIARFRDSGQADFATEIEEAKKQIYRIIREDYKAENPDYTEAELDADLANIKDRTGGYVKSKIIYQALSDIVKANEMLDLGKHYQDKANAINARSYIDLDSDDVVDNTERRNPQEKQFIRS